MAEGGGQEQEQGAKPPGAKEESGAAAAAAAAGQTSDEAPRVAPASPPAPAAVEQQGPVDAAPSAVGCEVSAGASAAWSAVPRAAAPPVQSTPSVAQQRHWVVAAATGADAQQELQIMVSFGLTQHADATQATRVRLGWDELLIVADALGCSEQLLAAAPNSGEATLAEFERLFAQLLVGQSFEGRADVPVHRAVEVLLAEYQGTCPAVAAGGGAEPAEPGPPTASSTRNADTAPSDLSNDKTLPRPRASLSAEHEAPAPPVAPVPQDCGAGAATILAKRIVAGLNAAKPPSAAAADTIADTSKPPVPQGGDVGVATRAPQRSAAGPNAAQPHSDATHADDTVGDTPDRVNFEAPIAAEPCSISTPQVQLIPTPSSSSSGYTCEYCGTIARVRYGTGRFCSRQCGARFSRNMGTKRAASSEDRQSAHASSRRKTADAGSERVARVGRTPHATRSRKSMDANTVKRCEAVLAALMEKVDAKPFCVRVDPNEYPGYMNFVTEPMDLSIVAANSKSGKYRTVAEFARHTRLVFENCLRFNHARSPICKVAHRLLAMFERLLQGWVMTAEPPEILDDGLCMVCATEDLKDHASMLLCDGCDAAYHMSCLSPPLSTVPLVDWFCPQCAEKRAPSDGEPANPRTTRTLRSSVCDRTEVERKALDRWLREHIGEPVMLQNGSVGLLQGFRFGYCQIDTGGVESTTKSPHEVSLNQAGLTIDYDSSAKESRSTAASNGKNKKGAEEPVATSPSMASESSSSSSPTPTSHTRSTRSTATAATMSIQPTSSPSADRTNNNGGGNSERPRSAWVCVNCLKQNSWNARKCSCCSELKGHTASEIATLNRSGYKETQQDRDVPAFLLARFATAVGFDRRMMSHKGTHDHAFCAIPSRSGASPSLQMGASRRIKSARINKCGHPERRHHAKGFCLKCYRTDLVKRKEALQSKAPTANKKPDVNATSHTAAAAAPKAATENDESTSTALLGGLNSTHVQRSAAPHEKTATENGTTSEASNARKLENPSESVQSAAQSANGTGRASDDQGSYRQRNANEDVSTSAGSNVDGASNSELPFRVPNAPRSTSTRVASNTQPHPVDPFQIKSETVSGDDSTTLPKDNKQCVGGTVQTLSGIKSQPCDSTTFDMVQEVDVAVARVTRHSSLQDLASHTMDATSVAGQIFAGADDTEVLPERPERLLCMYNHLKANSILEGTVEVAGREAILEELLCVHTAEYVRMVQDLENDEAAKDTPLAARLAVGTTTDTVSAVVVGHHGTDLQREQVQNGMAIVRPPGHHAGPNSAQGWCYFNNVAIAARVAQKNHGIKRVLIIDWDVHHGNGTEEIFYEDASVLTISLHRKVKDFYPESGAPDELGTGEGLGFNCNIAWSKDGMGDAEYMMAFSRIVLPLAYEFNPDLVLVSAGFDAGAADPLGGCCVTPSGFAQLTSMLMGLAGSKLVLVCEGGYNLRTISRSSAACLRVLRGEMPAPIARKLKPKQSAVADLLRTEIALSPYWSSFYRISTFSPYTTAVDGKGSATNAGSALMNSTSGFSTSSVPGNVSAPPQGTHLLSKDGLLSVLQTGELLHSKVSVWWRGDKQWYDGTIHEVDSTENTFVVHYDDSEITTETMDAIVALHTKRATRTRIQSAHPGAGTGAAAAASADVRSAVPNSSCDQPCPCPGASKRQRVQAWYHMNLSKTVRFIDGRKAKLLGPGRGYMQVQVHGDKFPSYARTRDLVVPDWVLSDTHPRVGREQLGNAARSNKSNAKAQRYQRGAGGGTSDAPAKCARRKTDTVESESSDESDSSDSSDNSEEQESDEELQLNQYRYTKWLQESVGKQINLKDGRRGTLSGSRTGFIEIVVRGEGVVRVRRHEVRLPRSVYHHNSEDSSEDDEDAAGGNEWTEESSDEDKDTDDRDETMNTYRFKHWIKTMIGREVTFKDGRRGKLVDSGAGFLRVRVKGAKELVSVRGRELDLPRFLFERDPLRRQVLDDALAVIVKEAPAAVRNQPPKRRTGGATNGKASKLPRN